MFADQAASNAESLLPHVDPFPSPDAHGDLYSLIPAGSDLPREHADDIRDSAALSMLGFPIMAETASVLQAELQVNQAASLHTFLPSQRHAGSRLMAATAATVMVLCCHYSHNRRAETRNARPPAESMSLLVARSAKPLLAT